MPDFCSVPSFEKRKEKFRILIRIFTILCGQFLNKKIKSALKIFRSEIR